MIYEQSHKQKIFYGTLNSGKKLIDSLEAICQSENITFGTIFISGIIKSVQLIQFDNKTNAWHTILDSDFEFAIVHANGSISSLAEKPTVMLQTLLAANGPTGQQFIFGTLKEASVVDVSFQLFVPTDLDVEFEANPKSQVIDIKSFSRLSNDDSLDLSSSKPFIASNKNSKSDKISWSDAAALATKEYKEEKPPLHTDSTPSEPTPDDIYADLDLDEPILNVGDTLIHRELGRCRVVRLQDDEFAHVRMARGKIRKLKLSLLDIKFLQKDDSGKSVFQATGKKS